MLAFSAALSVATSACAEEAAPVPGDTPAPAPATGDAAAPAAAPTADRAAPAVAVAPNVVAPDAPPARPVLQFEKFDDTGFLKARKSGDPVVLYFEADWCGPCKEMHETTFREPEVLAAATGAHLFRIDMSAPDRYVELVKKSFHVEGAPTVIMFGPGGKESARRFGFVSAKEFTKMLGDSRKPPASS